LGYEVKNRALVINETEAKKVRLIFRRYLELGSVHALAEELNKKKILSHRRVTQEGRTIGGRSRAAICISFCRTKFTLGWWSTRGRPIRVCIGRSSSAGPGTTFRNR